jgi:Domain of unknown function (DUF4440)
VRGDACRLGALLADDFLSMGEQGFPLGKREWIDRHCDFRYLAIETTEADGRPYTKTAILRFRSVQPRVRHGAPMTLTVRLRQVSIQQSGLVRAGRISAIVAALACARWDWYRLRR